MAGTGISIHFERTVKIGEEPEFQRVVLAAVEEVARRIFAVSFTVTFKAVRACCSCGEHVAAEIGQGHNENPFALIHYTRDRFSRKATSGRLVITSPEKRSPHRKWSDGPGIPDYSVEEVTDIIAEFLHRSLQVDQAELQRTIQFVEGAFPTSAAVSLT